jgi:hypothetical protein
MRMNNSTAHTQSALHQTSENPYPASGVVVEGKVIAVNPEDSTVDVALFGGQILRHVRVLFSSANTVAGFRYLSSVSKSDGAQNTQNGIVDKAMLTHIADTVATVVYVQGQTLAPRVIGFSLPIDSQMHINELGLAMFRHESGVYSLIDINGHHETHYPDGSYIIAGKDLNPKQMDTGSKAQSWETPTAPNIDMKIHLAQGVDITIQNGKIVLSAGQASLTVDGVGGTVTAKGKNNPAVTLAT